MRPISPKVKQVLEQEKNICALKDNNCGGRITWEHTLTYGSKQIDEVWAIIKLCEYHHSVNTYQDKGNLNKEKNVWVALNRATDEELLKYSKCINYLQLRERLNKKYGFYDVKR
jgi:hypothetical protein